MIEEGNQTKKIDAIVWKYNEFQMKIKIFVRLDGMGRFILYFIQMRVSKASKMRKIEFCTVEKKFHDDVRVVGKIKQ